MSVYAVHPHVRGDNESNSVLHRFLITRSTPTCVGTIREPTVNRPVLVAVHPHVRGDNLDSFWNSLIAFGSPPRAWGQLIFRDRIIALLPVHPHVRGDNVWERT